jgi:hypothetical protein
MNRKARVTRVFLAILFCMIAERAIAQVNFAANGTRQTSPATLGELTHLMTGEASPCEAQTPGRRWQPSMARSLQR